MSDNRDIYFSFNQSYANNHKHMPKWQYTLDDLLPKRLSSRAGHATPTAALLPDTIPLMSISGSKFSYGTDSDGNSAVDYNTSQQYQRQMNATLASFKIDKLVLATPIAVSIFTVVVISIVYILATAYKRVDAWPLPFISMAASVPELQAFFAAGMGISSIILSIICMIVYWQLRAKFYKLVQRIRYLKYYKLEASGHEQGYTTTQGYHISGSDRHADDGESRQRSWFKRIDWFSASSRVLLVLFLCTGLLGALFLVLLSAMPVFIFHDWHNSTAVLFFVFELVHSFFMVVLDFLYAAKLRSVIHSEQELSEVFVVQRMPSVASIAAIVEEGASPSVATKIRPKSKLEVSEGAQTTPLLKLAAPKRMIYVRLFLFVMMLSVAVLFPIAFGLRRVQGQYAAWFSVAAICEYLYVLFIMLFNLSHTMDFLRLHIDISIRVKTV